MSFIHKLNLKYTRTSIFLLKRFLLHWTDYSSERGHKLSHIVDENITSISNERYMSYEFFDEQPIQMVELNLNMIFEINPHLIIGLDRGIKQDTRIFQKAFIKSLQAF